MAKFKITFDRNTCIGAFACVAADPEHWKYADDGKVDFAGSKAGADGLFVLEIDDEKAADALKAAAEACPVYAIKFEKIE